MPECSETRVGWILASKFIINFSFHNLSVLEWLTMSLPWLPFVDGLDKAVSPSVGVLRERYIFV
jgi:hypothetical protein